MALLAAGTFAAAEPPSTQGGVDPEPDSDAAIAELLSQRLADGASKRPLAQATGLRVFTAAERDAGEEHDITRPDAARRVVARFGFERHLDDPSRAELFELPRFWDLAQDGSPIVGSRPGFPRWNRAQFDDSTAHRGESSIRLDARGGSTALRLQPGVAPVFPRTQYLVSARVRTRNMTHARAALVARYLDRANQPVEGSQVISRLVTAPHEPGEEWTLLSVTLAGTFDRAAFIQVDLEILQPERLATPTLGRHQLWPEDFDAAAWFDEVTIVQLPAVHLSVDAPGGVVAWPSRPAIDVWVRDLTGEDLTAQLILQDASGRVLDQTTRILVGGHTRWRWEPTLPALGWYRVVLELRSRSRRVGSAVVDLLWTPAEHARASTPSARGHRDRARFNLILDPWPAAADRPLAELVRAAGPGMVTVPVWSRSLTADQTPDLVSSLAPMITRWAAEARRVSLSLREAPSQITERAPVHPSDPLPVFVTDEDTWRPFLLPLLDRFGQTVSRWQVGQPDWEGRLPATPRDATAAALGRVLSRMSPGPMIALPWPVELASGGVFDAGPADAELILAVPAELEPDAVAELTRDRLAALPAGQTLTVALEARIPENHAPRHAAEQLVKQLVSAWASLAPGQVAGAASDRGPAPGIAIDQPWFWASSDGLTREPVGRPTPQLLAFRTAIDQLAGRRVLGRFPAAKGVTCWILGPESGQGPGALIAWQSAASETPAAFEAFLGHDAITITDIFGNRADLTPRHDRLGHLWHRVELSSSPVYIEGVDTRLALFVAGFSATPTTLAPTGAEQPIELILQNPWPARVSGRLAILEPGGLTSDPASRDRAWRFAPRAQNFVMDPGATLRLPVAVTFSEVEESGPKLLVAEVELATSEQYPPILVAAPLEVALPGLTADLSSRRAPTSTGPDLVVDVQVTNRSPRPTTLSISLFAPGQPRQRTSVTDLQPGTTATRRFVFPGQADALRGQVVTLGVQPEEGTGRLNRSLRID